MSFLAAILFAHQSLIAMPPYRHIATIAVGMSMQKPVVAGNRLYLICVSECRAYDLSTFKLLWRTVLAKGGYGEKVAVAGTTVLASPEPANVKQASFIFGLDSTTGAIKWKLPRTGFESPMAADGGTFFASLNPGRVSAVRLSDRRVLWNCTLPASDAKNAPGSSELGAVDVTRTGPKSVSTVLTMSGGVLSAIDEVTGKRLWSTHTYYTKPVFVGNVVWVSNAARSAGLDIRTGRQIWLFDAEYDDFGGVFRGKFVGLSEGSLATIDPKSGARTADKDFRSTGHSNVSMQAGSLFSGFLYVRNDDQAGVFDSTGKLVWKAPAESAIDPPIWTDGGSLVCFDGSRLLRYVHGSPAPLPTTSAGRKALAQDLSQHFAELDRAEVDRLESLGNDAFEPVLTEFENVCRVQDRHVFADHSPDDKPLSKADVDSTPEYDDYRAVAKVLLKISSPKRGPNLLEAMVRAPEKGYAKPVLMDLLSMFGSPSQMVPFFLKELNVTTPNFEMYESTTFVARSYIERSHDPRAVKFMLDQLENPKADPVLRESAYDNLSETGGPKEVAAVLALRRGRHLLPPIEDRMELDRVSAKPSRSDMTRLLAERKGKDGRDWGLLASGVLGSGGDLWLAEKVGGHWVHPRFTGVSTDGYSKWDKSPPPTPTIGGKNAKELVAGAWFDALVGNPALDRDSSGGGMTDLIKKRLGLDVSKKDSDGDGDPDMSDPWPNVPNRPLSESEKVLAAAFEARYHFSTGSTPAIFVAPPDIKPFEMVGWEGPVIWQTEREGEGRSFSTDLERCYEQGVAIIQFTPMSKQAKGVDQFIKWNEDHTAATVNISTYYGGLSGTGYEVDLKKIGEDWLVSGMKMLYIS